MEEGCRTRVQARELEDLDRVHVTISRLQKSGRHVFPTDAEVAMAAMSTQRQQPQDTLQWRLITVTGGELVKKRGCDFGRRENAQLTVLPASQAIGIKPTEGILGRDGLTS